MIGGLAIANYQLSLYAVQLPVTASQVVTRQYVYICTYANAYTVIQALPAMLNAVMKSCPGRLV